MIIRWVVFCLNGLALTVRGWINGNGHDVNEEKMRIQPADNHTPEYSNPYREKAKSLIESTISLSDYFSGDVNNVDIGIAGFHYQEGQIKSAECAVTFSQISPVDGIYFMVNGLIKLNEEGEFVYVVTYVG